MDQTAKSPQKEIFGHPVGLYILFFTEMWERFSYYGMRALLTLFLVASVTAENPGWGWTEGEAINLYKWYTTLVYLASIPGGIIADRWLGQKKTVMYGGLLLCIGHLVLAYENLTAFYVGLGFIIAGVGGLKPNISTMVGGLYKRGDDRRDKGFYIFYIGINLGAFLAGIIVGQVGEGINWHYGFGLAGIGMLLGQVVYIFGQKYLKGVGDYSGASEDAEEREAMKRPLSRVEKDRMIVMFLSFLIIIVFWGAFEQAGGLMNIYAKQNTDRMLFGWEVPASYFQSVNSFFIFTLAMLVAGFWGWWKMKGKESSSLFKMAIGVLVMGFGFVFMSFASLQYEDAGKSAMYWLILAYLFHTLGELCASPVALSFITKLAPVKYASLMMGAYFAATGLGNFVAGSIGEQISNASEFEIFTGIFIFCTIFAILVLLLLKPLKRLTHGAEDTKVDDANQDNKGPELEEFEKA
ncbi:proton-dependent oligopeptide transporter, POT family [Pustulibacterium marinum]|uniref:Proton-dependent oligopeptide transporter, POT family n=1 Tax=Pustulibacterium marinum TaxID=1224947 RepID=A0A1I7EV30_9FLAO|nr:peptide MFS transporter [Pustulibacterium marinum]SFU27753.1 proton-dependent oligopeptide transporter, POT family [Pustulibacterium marinum]